MIDHPVGRKLNVLFLHPNFPAQFKHLSKDIAQQGHQVKFLCQTHFGRTVDGVEKLILKNAAGKEALDKSNLTIFERSQKLAEQYRMIFKGLKKEGYRPDVVICHSGWGCGLHVKEVWPETRHISYSEWWFDPTSEFFTYDTDNLELNINGEATKKCWTRNQSWALEHANADFIVTPTDWQKDQLPKLFRDNCQTIFDGIDTNIFNPSKRVQSSELKKITYGTRGMDPMRCFPQFILELPEVLEHYPEIVIEIAGKDEASYGSGKPKNGKYKSWGSWAKRYLKTKNIYDRVRWVGYLNPDAYINWLRSSDCHIYLTHPFVASWSLVEAFCCGLPIITSDIKATHEICRDDPLTVYADHRERGFLKNALISLANHLPSNLEAEKMRSRAVFRFSRDFSLEQWERLWLV
jgi:glycosyltransferase involved in cell wall biosynthesis